MNIWILTSELPPSYGGGIGTYVDRAARMYSEKGEKVTIFVRDDNSNRIEFINPNLRIVRFKHLIGEQYSYLGYWQALAYQYAQEIEAQFEFDNEKPDIIEIQEYNAIGYYILQNRLVYNNKLKEVPIVLHLHTPTFELDKVNQFPRFKFPNYWIGQMEKFCIEAADAVMCPSEFLKKEILNEIEHKNTKIDVIRLPFFNDKVDTSEPRTCDSNTILYFGRTEYRKGVCQLIDGFSRYWSNGGQTRLKLIGGDTYFHPKKAMLREVLEAKYRKYIESGLLEFEGNMKPELLFKEIRKAKAITIPSLYENHPYTCVESMWLESPMLVSKSGGQAEMVGDDETAGYVFDWSIDGDFDKQLSKILDLSTNELVEMGKNAYSKIHAMCNTEHIYNVRIEYFKNVIKTFKSKDINRFPSVNLLPKKIKEKVNDEVKHRLSIIIPYYNLGEYLLESFESAMACDYSDFEVIIVNDGTTDKYSLEVLDKISECDYENVKVINIDNGGLANARNVGANASNSEFITFLDADDLVDKSFFSKAINVLNRYDNVSFVYSWLEYFDGNKGVWPTFNAEFPYLMCANMLSAFAVVRRVDFLNYGLNRPIMEYGMEDFDGWIGMLRNGCLGVSIPEKLVQYRIRGNSMSRQFNRDMIMYLFEKMSEEHSTVFNNYSDQIYNLLIANGPGYLWNNPSFEHDDVNYHSLNKVIENQVVMSDTVQVNAELKRIASSSLGQFLLKIMFKTKINRIFK